MSWWVYLEGEDGAVQVAPHMEGGTVEIGGTQDASMNVTYNYGEVFRLVWPSNLGNSGALKEMIDGRTGRESAPVLAVAVAKCGNASPYREDYWAPTIGNAKRALEVLLAWARQHPEATWRVS